MRNDCRVTTLRSELKVVFYALHYGMKPEVEMHDFGFHESETYEVMNHASAGKVAASTCHSLFHYVGARFTNPAWTLHRRPHFDTFQRNRSLLIAPLRWCLRSGVPSFVRTFLLPRTRNRSAPHSHSIPLSATPPKRDANMCRLIVSGALAMLLHLTHTSDLLL